MSDLHVVFQFQFAPELFVVMGVFSKRSDADALADTTPFSDRPNEPFKKATVAACTLSGLKAHLLQERLGQLHDVLLRVEKLLPLSPENAIVQPALSAARVTEVIRHG